MQYGLIGKRLTHSFSPVIHRAIGRYPYNLRELSPEKVGPFLLEHDFLGINVTIPYKETVLPYLCELDEGARALGSVNTILNKDGKLYGYNTDYFGMCALFSHAGIDPRGRCVAILGTGGTAKTAKGVLKHLGAREILTVSRTAREGAINYGELNARKGEVEVIVNTTPVGMYPSVHAAPISLDGFNALVGVIDAVYNPISTKLVLDAKARGIPAEGGLYMLVAQAVRAAELFSGAPIENDEIERIYRSVLRKKQNIVLVGMPGVGKSTVGKDLGRALGRTVLDTDAILKSRIGDIPTFIKEKGEAAFRDEESRVVYEIASSTSCVIATGGGAVLRQENVNNLLQNGRIYFLDRPLDDLKVYDNRPLSSTREALEARYRERYPIYSSIAEVTVSGTRTREQCVRTILEDFAK